MVTFQCRSSTEFSLRISSHFYRIRIFFLEIPALRKMSGEYLLNGNYVIDVTGPRDLAGMTVEYTRDSSKAEQLTAVGPASEPLMLAVSNFI